jgi:hypothetical protein
VKGESLSGRSQWPPELRDGGVAMVRRRAEPIRGITHDIAISESSSSPSRVPVAVTAAVALDSLRTRSSALRWLTSAHRCLWQATLVVVGIGVFFVAFRPPLWPEDRRYIAAPQDSLDAALPGLALWLEKVFWVMGGYMVATGILTIDLALSGVRDG